MADPTPLSTDYSLNTSVEILDDILIENVEQQNTRGSYTRLPPGTPHEDQETYPGYLFLTQKTTSYGLVQRYWTTPGFSNQDLTNWERDSVSDSHLHPIFQRRYKTRRDQYVEIARESLLTGLWQIKITNAGSGYDPDLPPAVTIGGPGSGATAVALVNPDGTIAWIRITAEGTGYTTAPLITITPPSAGVAATATSTVQGTSCYLIKQSTSNFPEDDPRFALFLIETRIYHTLPGPILTTWEYQERIDQYIRIDKQLILKSAVPANPNSEVLAAGITIEYQDITAVYSAKITTTIPTNFTWDNGGSANDVIYQGFIENRFPDEVREDPTIIVALTITANNAAIAYGWDCDLTEGYSGPCKAIFRERFTFNPNAAPFLAALPVPTSIFPEASTVWVATNSVTSSGQAQADIATFTVPLSLHGPLNVQNTSNPGSSPTPSGYDFRRTIPGTVPPGFEEGDSIVKISQPERVGIGGLWVVRMVEIFHPSRDGTP